MLPFRKIWVGISIFCATGSFAQEVHPKFKSTGAMVGFGFINNITTDMKSDLIYYPIFFSGDFAWQFGRKSKKAFLTYYLEPQFNLVITEQRLDIEFGNNIGFRFYQKINNSNYLYELLGTGPHFITAKVPTQASGFIFSDNLGMGFCTMLSNKLFLNIQLKLRHISNADLKEPNKGINTINFLIGLNKIKNNS